MPRKASDLDKHIGLRLRMRRILLNLSQEDLAEKLNVTFQQIQKYEKAINRISASRLYDIAQILEIDINYFFEGYISDDTKMQIKETSVTIGKPKNNLTQKNIILSLVEMQAGEKKTHIFNFLKQQLSE